jgi:hypothetical protein
MLDDEVYFAFKNLNGSINYWISADNSKNERVIMKFKFYY